jgi:hypothetical protein
MSKWIVCENMLAMLSYFEDTDTFSVNLGKAKSKLL